MSVFDAIVYLDNAATTRLDERVLEAMKPYFLETYAVATSQFGYSPGIEARDTLDAARTAIAGALGAAPEEFIFTSGSTESSNMALKGVAMALRRAQDAALGARLGDRRPSGKGKHIITSKIEDFPVL
ncbi:MAG: aminotransferase class V-fold PLP-dependent enzyme, partial [Anaerolineae bacterium]|nr:aminotransferase class V-fold PLP-dependent enzyme [Anaerolineae bacterium]